VAHGPSALVRSLRLARPLHRWAGVPLALLVLLSSVTGVLLAWKKASATLQPPTQEGVSARPADWRPLAESMAAAQAALHAHLGLPPHAPPPEVARVEVRPEKGVAKVLFEEGWWEVQVDLTTTRPLQVGRRVSDLVETLHDGSILGEGVKRVGMTWLGVGLVALSLSGAWLWLGARLARRRARAG
jgi:uncharacterized iron-regulated membrane protein